MEDEFIVFKKLTEVVKTMQECLQCTICLHPISDPVKTSCGHRYCRACMQSVLQNKFVQCPRCNKSIQRQNISEDEHMVVLIDRFQKFREAVVLDSVNNQRHVSHSDSRSSYSTQEEQDLVKPSCSYDNVTPAKKRTNPKPPAKKRTNPKPRHSSSRKEAKDQESKNKIKQKEGSSTVYLSPSRLSDLEPLNREDSNDYTVHRNVYNWLEIMQRSEPSNIVNKVATVESAECNLDDTLAMPVSQNCTNNGVANRNEDKEIVNEAVLRSNTRCFAPKASSRISLTLDIHNENKSNDSGDCRESFETSNAQNFTSKMNFDADNPQSSTSGVTKNSGKESSQMRIKNNWTTEERFEKIDWRKSGSSNESATNVEKEVAMSKEPEKVRGKYVKEEMHIEVREGRKPKVGMQVSKTKEFFEREKMLAEVEDSHTKEAFSDTSEDNWITDEIQPAGESSFITLTEGKEVRIRNLDSCQMNAIIGVANEDRRSEVEQNTTNDYGKPTVLAERHVHPANPPFQNRIKTFSRMTSAGSAEIRNQANLVNESNDEADNSSPSLMQGIELIDEFCSAPRLQASTPIGNRLSLKKQTTDPRPDNSCDPSVDSRLQAIRRDLNRQIDRSSGNAAVDNNSGGRIIETEKNRSSNNGKHNKEQEVRGSIVGSSRRRDDVDYTRSPVIFKKLGKVYKYAKTHVSFFYLGRTRQEQNLGSSYCDLRLQKPYSLVDILNVQDLEYTCASGSGFGNNALITVNETPIIEHDEVEIVCVKEIESVEKPKTVSVAEDAFTNRFDVPKESTSERIVPVRNAVYDNLNKSSIDVVLLTLNENEETVQPCAEHSTTLLKNTSPTKKKNSQQQFLNIESPSMDTLATQIFVHDTERSKGSTSKAPSKVLARTSQDPCSTDPPFTPAKRRESSTEKKSFSGTETGSKDETGEEEYASDHSFSSQVTYVPKPKKVSHLMRKSSSSSVSSIRDNEAVRFSSDRNNVDFTNDQLDVPAKSKRKRSVCSDSSDDEDLHEIVNKCYETGKNGIRCKKKSKSEQERDAIDSKDASAKARASTSYISRSTGNKFAGNRSIEKFNLIGTESNTETSNRQTVIVNEDSPDFGSTINKVKDICNRETVSEESFIKHENLMEDNFDDIIANVDTAELASNYNRDISNTCKSTSAKGEFFDDNCERKYRQERSFNLSSSTSDKETKRSVSGVLYDNSYSTADKTLVPEHTDATRKSLKKDKFQEEIELVDSSGKETMIPPSGATRLLVNQMSIIHSDITTEPTVKNNTYAQDSLMNITEESLMMKQFEQDLFGRPLCYEKEQRTPQKLKKDKRSNDEEVEHSGEEDDIVENTPDTKTKMQATNLSRRSSTVSPFSKITGTTSGKSSSDVSSPIWRREIDPLCQSTPKAHQSNTKSAYGLTKFTLCNEQTSIPNSVLRTAENVKVVNNQSLCFVCSSLVASQIEKVNRLARMVNARYVTQFELEVTHVIVQTNNNNNGAEKTLKYLQGIVHKKWIVSYKWVVDSLNEGRLVDELPYEAVDSMTLEAGPRKSRLREKDLFAGFAFLCIGPYPDVSLEQYQNLLRATGAIVVDNLDELATERTKLKIIVIQSNVYAYEISEWYKKARAVAIFYDWVVECISQYKLTSFYPYLQELSRQDVQKLGFPEYLVEEVYDEDSDSICDAST